MRSLVEIVENLTSSVRFIVGALMLAGMAAAMLMTVGGAYVAPIAVDSIAERAERVGEKAIKAAQEERRAVEMGKDGWGYDAATDADADDARRPGGAAGDGWAQ
jgi:hypothetical protein